MKKYNSIVSGLRTMVGELNKLSTVNEKKIDNNSEKITLLEVKSNELDFEAKKAEKTASKIMELIG